MIKLTEYAAHWVDLLEKDSQPQIEHQIFEFFALRAVSVVVFPIFAALDVITHTVLALGAWLFIPMTYDEVSGIAMYALLCLLALVRSPWGMVRPNSITFHFLPTLARDGVQACGKLYEATPSRIECPTSVEEIQEIVIAAQQQGQSISIAGAKFSQGKQTLPSTRSGIYLDMAKINHVTIEGDIARVGAGATWQQVQESANQHKLAVAVMQASNVFSVGGSLSVNCHGWDHLEGSLGNTVRAITIVNARGQIEKLSPGDELFSYVVGGYGLFGVIVEVELFLKPNETLIARGVKVPLDAYTQYFREQVLPCTDIRMHLYRLSINPDFPLGEGIALNYTYGGEATVTPHLSTEQIEGDPLLRSGVHVLRGYGSIRASYWEWEKGSLVDSECLATRNEIMRPIINVIFNRSISQAEWLQEFFVPCDELAPFLTRLGEILKQNEVVLENASVRFVRQDEVAKLGYAAKGDRFAVVLCFNQSLAQYKIDLARRWIQEALDEVSQRDGSYYLCYQHFATQAQFKTCYGERWSEVQAMKAQVDPNNLFYSGFFETYREKSSII